MEMILKYGKDNLAAKMHVWRSATTMRIVQSTFGRHMKVLYRVITAGFGATTVLITSVIKQMLHGMSASKDLGAKASCAGKCGSNEPQKLVHGVCYCDANCSKYLDCCIDYAKDCGPKQPPTCKGCCNKVTAQPLLGGGYCWCSAGCNHAFIGGSSCCADYQHYCESGKLQPCLDGRTQGSALNLFLCHSIVSKVAS